MEQRVIEKSGIVKRSVVIGSHKTSVSLEDCFWVELRLMALQRQMQLSSLLEEIDLKRTHKNLSSAIRIRVLEHFRNFPATN